MRTQESKQCKQKVEVKQVTADDLKLNTFDGFNRRFDKYLKECKTQQEAYVRAEMDHNRVFEVDKYSGYNSFRNVRNNRMKVNR